MPGVLYVHVCLGEAATKGDPTRLHDGQVARATDVLVDRDGVRRQCPVKHETGVVVDVACAQNARGAADADLQGAMADRSGANVSVVSREDLCSGARFHQRGRFACRAAITDAAPEMTVAIGHAHDEASSRDLRADNRATTVKRIDIDIRIRKTHAGINRITGTPEVKHCPGVDG